MTDKLIIRKSEPADLAAIESLYVKAFPDEDLIPLVRGLLPDVQSVVSLVATKELQIVGHALFTKCGVSGNKAKAALLGPLAVLPASQRQGVGSAIVRDGLRRMKEEGVQVICVLGDPAYYSRLGFLPEALVEPPFPLPDEWAGAWQSLYLGDVGAKCAGRLTIPRQWLKPALWAP